MSTELKSSDEILQELFGMCSKTKKSIHSSNESSQSNSGVEDDASTKKHKKKKKKHKKMKKRGRSSSDESDSNDHKTHKRKKKKSHKDEDKSKKLKIKIKTEPGEPEKPSKDNNCTTKKDNLMDTATGRKLTIDDVFNSLGILPKTEIKIEKGLSLVKSSKENGYNEKQTNDIKEAILPAPPNSSPIDKIPLKVEKDTTSDQSISTKTKLNDVFDTDPNHLAEKNKLKAKKINIDNLKNSCVYEATIKEIEERERKKAEKYEEGELSSSNSSQNDMSDDNATEAVNDTDSQKKEKRRHKHKHRSKSKSHERSRSKHRSRSHHSKHSHEKTSHKSHRSDKSSVSPPRHSRSSKSYHDHHHHSAHHRSYYSYYSRASSVEGRGSPRSRRSRDEKRGKSSDRSHSRTLSKVTSKERKSRSKSIEKIDKQKLLEIARKNAITLLKQGALPASVVVNKEKITSIKAGGKTVDELTDFCKQLSKKEAEGQESLSSGSELDEEREKAFHHPFQLKERPSGIVMNIRNAVSLPTKTAQEKTLELSKQLSLQYPVSSGQQHRTTESEWVPVEKTPDPIPAPVVLPPPAPIVPAAPVTISGNQPYHALEHPPVAYPTVNYNGYSNQIPLPQPPNNDIGSIVAERLEAIRRLTENPSDPIGNNLIQVADTKMKVWAESKVQPGLFTGSTGVRTLSAAELSSGFKAWPKKFLERRNNRYVNSTYKLYDTPLPKNWIEFQITPYIPELFSLWKTRLICLHTPNRLATIVPENMLQNQFIVAKPVVSDKGEALMKKMGWQPGEGLGKYKQGPPEPCEISMKTDRKGLAEQTVGFQQSNSAKRAFELSQNKHPVSLLNEYCSRKKIGTPAYDCEEKDGAGKRKLFLFSVTVKGMKYTPQMPCCNKKQSKIEAATLCLQNLGLLPSS